MAYYLSIAPEDNSYSQETVKAMVEEFCLVSSLVDSSIMVEINKGRVAAGFREMVTEKEIKAALDKHQQFYRRILHSFLDKQDSILIADALTQSMEKLTNMGETECSSPVLEALITDYGTEVLPFFEKQEAVIDAIIADIVEEMKQKTEKATVNGKFETLQQKVALWRRIARPMQILFKSQRTTHKRSEEVLRKLRALSNIAQEDYGFTELSQRLSELQESVFDGIHLATKNDQEDKANLLNIIRGIREGKAESTKSKEHEYYMEWGIFFNGSLLVDSESITINGKYKYPYWDMEGISWSTTQNYLNGFYTGRSYDITLIVNQDCIIELPIKNNKEAFESIVSILWETAVPAILSNLLNRLRNGNTVHFYNASISDDWIELGANSLLSLEKRCFTWGEIQRPFSENGKMVIKSTDGKYVSYVPYYACNARILELMLYNVLNYKGTKSITESFQIRG